MQAPEADTLATNKSTGKHGGRDAELGPLSTRASIINEDQKSAIYLIRGLYKMARGWHDRGHIQSAKCIYRFIVGLRDKFPDLACLEVTLSLNNLALILMLENAVVEAEDMFVRALASCYQILGDEHEIFANLLLDYADLMRLMGLEDQARALEMRAGTRGRSLPAVS